MPSNDENPLGPLDGIINPLNAICQDGTLSPRKKSQDILQKLLQMHNWFVQRNGVAYKELDTEWDWPFIFHTKAKNGGVVEDPFLYLTKEEVQTLARILRENQLNQEQKKFLFYIFAIRPHLLSMLEEEEQKAIENNDESYEEVSRSLSPLLSKNNVSFRFHISNRRKDLLKKPSVISYLSPKWFLTWVKKDYEHIACVTAKKLVKFLRQDEHGEYLTHLIQFGRFNRRNWGNVLKTSSEKYAEASSILLNRLMRHINDENTVIQNRFLAALTRLMAHSKILDHTNFYTLLIQLSEAIDQTAQGQPKANSIVHQQLIQLFNQFSNNKQSMWVRLSSKDDRLTRLIQRNSPTLNGLLFKKHTASVVRRVGINYRSSLSRYKLQPQREASNPLANLPLLFDDSSDEEKKAWVRVLEERFLENPPQSCSQLYDVAPSLLSIGFEKPNDCDIHLTKKVLSLFPCYSEKTKNTGQSVGWHLLRLRLRESCDREIGENWRLGGGLWTLFSMRLNPYDISEKDDPLVREDTIIVDLLKSPEQGPSLLCLLYQHALKVSSRWAPCHVTKTDSFLSKLFKKIGNPNGEAASSSLKDCLRLLTVKPTSGCLLLSAFEIAFRQDSLAMPAILNTFLELEIFKNPLWKNPDTKDIAQALFQTMAKNTKRSETWCAFFICLFHYMAHLSKEDETAFFDEFFSKEWGSFASFLEGFIAFLDKEDDIPPLFLDRVFENIDKNINVFINDLKCRTLLSVFLQKEEIYNHSQYALILEKILNTVQEKISNSFDIYYFLIAVVAINHRQRLNENCQVIAKEIIGLMGRAVDWHSSLQKWDNFFPIFQALQSNAFPKEEQTYYNEPLLLLKYFVLHFNGSPNTSCKTLFAHIPEADLKNFFSDLSIKQAMLKRPILAEMFFFLVATSPHESVYDDMLAMMHSYLYVLNERRHALPQFIQESDLPDDVKKNRIQKLKAKIEESSIAFSTQRSILDLAGMQKTRTLPLKKETLDAIVLEPLPTMETEDQYKLRKLCAYLKKRLPASLFLPTALPGILDRLYEQNKNRPQLKLILHNLDMVCEALRVALEENGDEAESVLLERATALLTAKSTLKDLFGSLDMCPKGLLEVCQQIQKNLLGVTETDMMLESAYFAVIGRWVQRLAIGENMQVHVDNGNIRYRLSLLETSPESDAPGYHLLGAVSDEMAQEVLAEAWHLFNERKKELVTLLRYSLPDPAGGEVSDKFALQNYAVFLAGCLKDFKELAPYLPNGPQNTPWEMKNLLEWIVDPAQCDIAAIDEKWRAADFTDPNVTIAFKNRDVLQKDLETAVWKYFQAQGFLKNAVDYEFYVEQKEAVWNFLTTDDATADQINWWNHFLTLQDTPLLLVDLLKEKQDELLRDEAKKKIFLNRLFASPPNNLFMRLFTDTASVEALTGCRLLRENNTLAFTNFNNGLPSLYPLLTAIANHPRCKDHIELLLLQPNSLYFGIWYFLQDSFPDGELRFKKLIEKILTYLFSKHRALQYSHIYQVLNAIRQDPEYEIDAPLINTFIEARAELCLKHAQYETFLQVACWSNEINLKTLSDQEKKGLETCLGSSPQREAKIQALYYLYSRDRVRCGYADTFSDFLSTDLQIETNRVGEILAEQESLQFSPEVATHKEEYSDPGPSGSSSSQVRQARPSSIYPPSPAPQIDPPSPRPVGEADFFPLRPRGG